MEKDKNGMPRAELISLVFEMGFTIAIPIVILTIVGRWLDRSLGTSPLFILIGAVLAVSLSSFLVYHKLSKLLK